MKRFALVVGVLLATANLALVVLGWVPFGKTADGDRLAAMEASAQWEGRGFENPQPLWNDFWGSATAWVETSPVAVPTEPVPVIFDDGSRLDTPSETGLRVTWLGHSTMLIELDGSVILTDPIFGQRASPYEWLGPRRWYDPPIPLEGLPDVDVVLISHDHYDHLQHATIVQMIVWDCLFVVPLGVGAHLAYWGIPEERIVELDWWDERAIGELTVTSTPARHASGRHLFDQNDTLWAGYALHGTEHRAFYSGDTGYFPALSEIGERLGPFDLTMIEVGAYNRAWPDWHMGPEQAVRAHRELQGDVFMPVHWGLWNLAMHGWTEPMERVLVAAEQAEVTVAAPRPGGSFEPATVGPVERWWPEVAWQTAEEHPIVARGVE